MVNLRNLLVSKFSENNGFICRYATKDLDSRQEVIIFSWIFSEV